MEKDEEEEEVVVAEPDAWAKELQEIEEEDEEEDERLKGGGEIEDIGLDETEDEDEEGGGDKEVDANVLLLVFALSILVFRFCSNFLFVSTIFCSCEGRMLQYLCSASASLSLRCRMRHSSLHFSSRQRRNLLK